MSPDDNVKKNLPPIRQGTVYYFVRHRDVKWLREPHYHIVLNKSPLDDECIYTAIITSEEELRKEKAKKKNLSLDAIVKFDKSEYGPLKWPSVVDCNFLAKLSLEKFNDAIGKSLAKKRIDFPPEAFKKLLEGVAKSNKVTDQQKKLFGCPNLPEENPSQM